MTVDEARANPLPPGFDDVEPLTATGCGQIYRARVATADGRSEQIAVTLVRTAVRDRGARRRLRADCLAAVAVNAEPAVLAVRDLAFTDDHHPLLITDLPAHGTLADRLEHGGPLLVAEVVATGLRLARALAAAHREGVLHLGIAPDVVFASAEGPVLGHFGLAWAVRPPTQPDIPAADIVHAPRELFGWEEPTVGSDVYGLASVLRTAITGQAPFLAEARIGRAALYHRLVQGAPPPLQHPGVPPELAMLLDRMMVPDPARRPGLDEVVGILEAVSALPGIGTAGRPGMTVGYPGPVVVQGPPIAPPGPPMVAQGPAMMPQGPAMVPPGPAMAPQDPPMVPAQTAMPQNPPMIPAQTPMPQQSGPVSAPAPSAPEASAPAVPTPAAEPAPAGGVVSNVEHLAKLMSAPASAPASTPAPAPESAPIQSIPMPAPAPTPLPWETSITAATPTPQPAPAAPPSFAVSPWDPREAEAHANAKNKGKNKNKPTKPAQAPPATEPAEGRRSRNTGLILLVASGAAALAAGVAWGVATGDKQKNTSDQNTPVVMVQTFDPAQQAAYQVTGIKAQPSGTSVTVTWGAPAKTDGITSYVIVAGLHDKDVKDTTVSAGKYSATITDLRPGTQYCFSVITLAHPPGDSSLRMAKPTTCYQATTGAAGSTPGADDTAPKA